MTFREIQISTSLCIISTVFIFLLLQSCHPIVETLGPFSSPSIEEAKKRDVFLWEYYPLSIKVYDTLDFDINEVFAEKQYCYHSYNDLTYKISKDITQVKIVSKKKLSSLEYFDSWVVDGFDWSAAPYGLVREYKNETPPDTLYLNLLKVDVNKSGGAGKEDKKIIGSFKLIRKRR